VSGEGRSGPPPPRRDAQPWAAESQERWLARARAGDVDVFQEIFTSYYEALRDFAEAISGSADEAEEAIQEVFLRIWRARSRWEVHGSLKSYLFEATRNQVLNRLRDRRARTKWTDLAAESEPHVGMGMPGISADRAAEGADLRAAIDLAISRLPTRCRQVFVLHRKHGLSYSEIADYLGVSPKTIEKQVARALKQLREELAPLIRDR